MHGHHHGIHAGHHRFDDEQEAEGGHFRAVRFANHNAETVGAAAPAIATPTAGKHGAHRHKHSAEPSVAAASAGDGRLPSFAKLVAVNAIERRKKPISAGVSVTMSPWEKLLRGRLPGKQILTLVNLILLTVLIVACQVPRIINDMGQRRLVISTFMPSGYAATNVTYEAKPTSWLYTTSMVRSAIATAVSTYYAVGAAAPTQYNYFYTNRSGAEVPQVEDILPPEMVVTLATAGGRFGDGSGADGAVTLRYELSPDNPLAFFTPGPSLSTKPLKDCKARRDHMTLTGDSFLPCRSTMRNANFDGVRRALITMRFRSPITFDAFVQQEASTHWTLLYDFDFTANGIVKLSFSCDGELHRHLISMTPYTNVAVALVFFALLDLLLRCRSLRKIVVFMRVKRRQMKKEVGAESTTEEDDSDDDLLHGHPGGALRNGGAAQTGTGATGTPTLEGSVALNASFSWRPGAITTQDSRKLLAKMRWTMWKSDLRNGLGLGWLIWGMVTDGLCALYGIVNIVQVLYWTEPVTVRYAYYMLGGVAGFFLCVSIVAYFRYWPKLYVLVAASAVAMPHLMAFLVAVLPVFCAFAIFAVIAFGAYAAQYATFFESCTALYAAIFGDSLLQAFQVSGNTNSTALYVASVLHSLVFIALFIWVILNVALAMVVDGFGFVDDTFQFFDEDYTRRLLMQKSPTERLRDATRRARLAIADLRAVLSKHRSRYGPETQLQHIASHVINSSVNGGGSGVWQADDDGGGAAAASDSGIVAAAASRNASDTNGLTPGDARGEGGDDEGDDLSPPSPANFLSGRTFHFPLDVLRREAEFQDHLPGGAAGPGGVRRSH